MKHSYSFSLIILPLLMLLVLASTLFAQRSGIAYEINSQYYQEQQFLPDDIIEVNNYFSDKPQEGLVIYDSQNSDRGMTILLENVQATLESIRALYDVYDINSSTRIDLTSYQSIIFVALDISKIESQSDLIVNWAENGGKILFVVRPDPSFSFDLIARNLGFTSISNQLISTEGIEFTTDILPGSEGKTFGLQSLKGSSYAVELDDNCIVHAVSADTNKTPLVWVCNIEAGRIAFINSDQFSDRASRGLIAATYTLLYDTYVYPVINSSVLYIDDFPAPLPEGSNEYITRYYDMDNFTFFRDVWWPEMQAIAEKYDIRFTAGMIETYTEQVSLPLVKQLEPETHRYFGRSLLSSGGEIIFHGHNHVPFCTANNDVNRFYGYPSWPDTESAQLSLVEVYNFGNSVFPDYYFLGYMPPSNILCSDSRRWLPMVIPDLKYIASIYLPDEDGHEYVQEFAEASDGIIEFPRIISGYDIYDNEYMQWAAINELGLHYINSHFLHPDDLFDPKRGAEKGWENLRDQYDLFLQSLQNSAPGLRNMTGSEGAMAVQRFARLAIKTNVNNNMLEISLGNFYDEAWLLFRSVEPPLAIDGGVIIQISNSLYLIQALNAEILISFEE